MGCLSIRDGAEKSPELYHLREPNWGAQNRLSLKQPFKGFQLHVHSLSSASYFIESCAFSQDEMTTLLSWLSKRQDYLVLHPDRCTLDNLRHDKACLEEEDLVAHITNAQQPDDNFVTSYDSDETTISLTNEPTEVTALDANSQKPVHADETAEITALDANSQNPDLSGAETWSQENAQLTEYPALHLLSRELVNVATKPSHRMPSLGASRRPLVPPARNQSGVSMRASSLRLGKHRPVMAKALKETDPEETFCAISKDMLRAVADAVQAEQLPKQSETYQRIGLDRPPMLPPTLATEEGPESYDEKFARYESAGKMPLISIAKAKSVAENYKRAPVTWQAACVALPAFMAYMELDCGQAYLRDQIVRKDRRTSSLADGSIKAFDFHRKIHKMLKAFKNKIPTLAMELTAKRVRHNPHIDLVNRTFILFLVYGLACRGVGGTDRKSKSKCSSSIIFEFPLTIDTMFEFDHWPETQAMLKRMREALDLIESIQRLPSKDKDRIYVIGEKYSNKYLEIINLLCTSPRCHQCHLDTSALFKAAGMGDDDMEDWLSQYSPSL